MVVQLVLSAIAGLFIGTPRGARLQIRRGRRGLCIVWCTQYQTCCGCPMLVEIIGHRDSCDVRGGVH